MATPPAVRGAPASATTPCCRATAMRSRSATARSPGASRSSSIAGTASPASSRSTRCGRAGRDLARRLGPGHPVIFDVKCSQVLAQELTRSGLRPTMWKTGHSLIKQKMKELGAPLAGEMSGHMFFGGDWYGFDDALFAAARLLQYVAELGGPLSRLLADLPATVSTPEVRVDCADEHKFAIVERAAQHFAARYPVSTLDGVRITFPDGWGLVRASNTQPVLVLRFEAGSESALAAYRAEVEDWLAAQGVRP